MRLELRFSPEVGAESCAADAAGALANGVSREQLPASPRMRTCSGSPVGMEMAATGLSATVGYECGGHW